MKLGWAIGADPSNFTAVCMYTETSIEFGPIIRTVVRIVGMGRMSHICNTKCSRL